MHVLAIYVFIFAFLPVLLIKEFKTWGKGESQSLLWLLWTLCQSNLMTKGAACSAVSCLQGQPLGKSTIVGQPIRLQGLAGDWEGTQLDSCPSALAYSSAKISPTSACQSVRTWLETIFHCPERFLSRRRSWTEKRGLERPFNNPSVTLFRGAWFGAQQTAEVLHQQEISCCIQWMLNQLLFMSSSQKGFLLSKKMREVVVLSPPASWKTYLW